MKALVLLLSLLLALAVVNAVDLTISVSGHSSGLGQQNLSFTGDRFNVSLQQNGTVWNITAEGGA